MEVPSTNSFSSADLSLTRALFYDASGGNYKDAVNNYSKVKDAIPILCRGEILSTKKKYNIVALCGHGYRNEISTGSGMHASKDKTKEITLKNMMTKEAVPFLKKVKRSLFDRELGNGQTVTPILFLAGCEIFDNKDTLNLNLIQLLSHAFKDVLVIAPTTYLKPELQNEKLEMKLEARLDKNPTFDFFLTLGAYFDGSRVEDIKTILTLTGIESEEILQSLLCDWELK